MSVQPVNPFVLAPEAYKRDIDVFKHYLLHSADYLSTMTGKPVAECFEWVKNQLKPGGRFPFQDPKIQYLERGENGDRELKEGSLYQYITGSIRENQIIAPTLTTYLHPKVKKSLLATYIVQGKKRRNKAKKEMFAAEMAKDMPLYMFKKLEQTNAKQKNNSLSGAHNSSSTPLFNKTAHSTLTSTCRSTSGYGNANNEKFLAGNRHYWAPFVVTNNMVSIVRHTDYVALQALMDKYDLHYPTAEEALSVIEYSTRHYWGNEKAMAMFLRYLQAITPIQRAAFVYTGDLYHIRRFNPQVVDRFVTGISARVDVAHAEPGKVFDLVFEDQRNLAMQICSHVSKGFTLKDLKQGFRDDKGKKIICDPNAYAIVASTAENIYNTVVEYGDFIRTFFVTENVPASMAYFPDSIRHVALISDTDSTIFTAQEWVGWKFGKIGFSDEENNLSSSMIYLASASITHILARMSANLGVETEVIHAIAMKNEFKFDIIAPTQVGKHYFAYISAQEGNVFDDFKEEIKGVHLKNSNVPKAIMKDAKDMMLDSMRRIMAGEMVDMRACLSQIGGIERGIVSSITAGSHDFFKFGRINSKESYKQDENRSNYRHYHMWQEVFAPDYGDVPPPPYTCLKLSTELDTMGKTNDWLMRMKNQALAARMKQWLVKNDKSYLGMLMLPEGIVQARGIPPELLEVVDIRTMILDSTNVFYLMMEAFGIYMLNDKKTKLFMDYY
jgi:hypothetical protein